MTRKEILKALNDVESIIIIGTDIDTEYGEYIQYKDEDEDGAIFEISVEAAKYVSEIIWYFRPENMLNSKGERFCWEITDRFDTDEA